MLYLLLRFYPRFLVAQQCLYPGKKLVELYVGVIAFEALRHRYQAQIQLRVSLYQARHYGYRRVEAHRQVVYPVQRPHPEILEVESAFLESELLLYLPSGHVVHDHGHDVRLRFDRPVGEQRHGLARTAEIAVDGEILSAVKQPHFRVRRLRDDLASLVSERYEYLSFLPFSLADQAGFPRLYENFPVLSRPDDEILPMGCHEIDHLVVVVAAVEDEDGFPFAKPRAHELEAFERICVRREVAGLRLRMEDVVNGHRVLARRGQRGDAAHPVSFPDRPVRRRRVPDPPERFEGFPIGFGDVGVVDGEDLEPASRHHRNGERQQSAPEFQVGLPGKESGNPLYRFLRRDFLGEGMGDVAQYYALPLQYPVHGIHVEFPGRLVECADGLFQMVQEKPIEPVNQLAKITHVGYLASFVAFGFSLDSQNLAQMPGNLHKIGKNAFLKQ